MFGSYAPAKSPAVCQCLQMLVATLPFHHASSPSLMLPAPPLPSPRSGSMTLRQIHFASVDLELHARFTPGKVCCG